MPAPWDKSLRSHNDKSMMTMFYRYIFLLLHSQLYFLSAMFTSTSQIPGDIQGIYTINRRKNHKPLLYLVSSTYQDQDYTGRVLPFYKRKAMRVGYSISRRLGLNIQTIPKIGKSFGGSV